jgi:hypothetical protein
MDFKQACDILCICENNITKKKIKKAYFAQALKWHPDKNISLEAPFKFQEIQNAYDFLQCNTHSHDYSIISQFINNITGINIDFTTDLLSSDNTLLDTLLEKIDYDSCFKLAIFFSKYSFLLNKNNTLFSKIHRIINNKVNNNSIIIEPSIDNLFNNDIYNLDLGYQEVYCIPLWHQHVEFDYEDIKINVNIRPKLPTNIFIDDDNNIHIYKTISNKRESIDVHIADRCFNIPLNSHDNPICFTQRGISRINTTDLFSVDVISDVFVHITYV